MTRLEEGNTKLESACHNGLLTFSLGEQEYALDIIKVQEIRGYERVTVLANLPNYIKGVLNLRGTIVPIVDLRIKFGLSNSSYMPTTVVIILALKERLVGIVVDAVSDVISIEAAQIKPSPELGKNIDLRYLMGIATLEERVVVLIDIETLLSSDDLQLIECTPA